MGQKPLHPFAAATVRYLRNPLVSEGCNGATVQRSPSAKGRHPTLRETRFDDSPWLVWADIFRLETRFKASVDHIMRAVVAPGAGSGFPIATLTNRASAITTRIQIAACQNLLRTKSALQISPSHLSPFSFLGCHLCPREWLDNPDLARPDAGLRCETGHRRALCSSRSPRRRLNFLPPPPVWEPLHRCNRW